jgi:uncharacterized membrane protein
MKFGKILALFVLLTVFAAAAPYASAYSNIGMALSAEKVATCPADTKTIELTITNNDVTTHTYTLSLELPQGWTTPDNGFIQPASGPLASGESQKILFWVNSPAANPGIYNVKVRAKIGVDEISSNLEVEILRCHSIAINTPANVDVCADSDFQYSFSAANNGKETEEFDVVATGSWSSKELYKETVSIEAGKTRNFVIDVAAPKESGRITVRAASKTSYANDEEYTQVNVNKCYDFDASLEPKESSACVGSSAKYMLTITNKGTSADVYAIQAPQWVIPAQPNITIMPGEEKSVELNAFPEVKGKTSFEIKIASKGYEKLSKALKASIEAKVCMSVAVIVSPASQEVCKGLPVEFKVTVKNTGMASDTYDLSTNLGILESNKATVDAGEIKALSLKIETKDITEKAGEKTVTVTAKSGDISDQNSVQLALKNCYSAEFGVSPQTASLCAGEEVAYTVIAKNTGEFADNYTIGIEDKPLGSVSLAPGEMKMFSTTIKVGFSEGENKLTFTLASEHVSMQAGANITVKPETTCYKLDFAGEGPAKSVDAGKGIAIAVKVKNSGLKDDAYKLELISPGWMHLNGDSLALKSGEEAYIYIYASPGFDVKKGTYNAQLKATSQASGEHDFDFKVGVGMVPAEDSKPANGFNIPTGAIINLSSNTGKILLLALIVLLIIIILVVKFVLFVK